MKKIIAFALVSLLGHNNSIAESEIIPGCQNSTIKIHYVEIIKATPKTVAEYGVLVNPEDFATFQVPIVTWPQPGKRPIQEGTGNQGGTTEGDFTMEWRGNKLYANNHAVNGSYLTGWATFPDDADSLPVIARADRRYLLTHEINYHPDGGQLFMPKDGKPFVALLGLPGEDISPEHFKAFYFDGSCGVCIHPGVWHQPPFSVEDSMTLLDRQGKVHACIYANFIEEFGCYLAVPLFDPEQLQ